MTLREFLKRNLIVFAILALVFLMVGCGSQVRTTSQPMEAVVQKRNCNDWNGCWTYVKTENGAVYTRNTSAGAIGDTILIVIEEHYNGRVRWDSPTPQELRQ